MSEKNGTKKKINKLDDGFVGLLFQERQGIELLRKRNK